MKLEQHLSLDLQMRAFKVGQNEDICRIPRKSLKVNLFIVSSKADKVRKRRIKVETIPKFQNIYIKTTNFNQMTLLRYVRKNADLSNVKYALTSKFFK